MLRPAPSGAARGYTLVELLIALVVLMVLLSVGVPSLASWMRDAKLRATAEALTGGLYQARAEAARRNAVVRVQLTTTTDNSCALAASGQNWLVSLAYDASGNAASPAGACASAVSDTSAPYVLLRSSSVSAYNRSVLAANRAVLAFDGLGRLNDLRGSTTATAFTVDVTASDATCLAAGGTVRCLRVVVLPAGLITLCDPARTATTDPMACPST